MQASSTADHNGGLFWVTGLPGAGKSTLARELHARLLPANKILLDGDQLREILGPLGGGYSRPERLLLAEFYSRLCRDLARQGAWVVCATVSLMREVHELNRRSIPQYVEIFVHADEAQLKARNQKGLYSGAQPQADPKLSAAQAVLGFAPDFPANPTLTLDNSGQRTPAQLVDQAIRDLAESAPFTRALFRQGLQSQETS